jgi:uncharacterized protein (DUF2345 family)
MEGVTLPVSMPSIAIAAPAGIEVTTSDPVVTGIGTSKRSTWTMEPAITAMVVLFGIYPARLTPTE